jgi:metallo-beta-lactamase class B
MLKKIFFGFGTAVVAATILSAQTPPAPQAGAQDAGARDTQAGPGRGGGRGGGSPKLPTDAQWAAMPAKAKEYVDKARALAGDDPDLQFDFGIFCRASGGSQNQDRATIGVPNSEPKLTAFPAPSPAQVLGGQRLFDNFYWIGNTGIGAWLITSDDGYILFDSMNSEDDARDIIVPAIKKLNLDPMKIKFMVFGHNHFDHTGGGEYMQRLTGAKAIMARDDWDIYLRAPARGAGGGGRGARGGADASAQGTSAGPQAAGGRGAAAAPQGAAPPAAPSASAPKMRRDIDATDGMEITIGNKQKVTATIFEMTGHTPGSIGMVVPVRYQGREHPILLVTAGTDINNRAEFIGGYEHIWDMGIKMKVESVMQDHPNTNMNLLARTKYVNDNYPPAKNPLLYGAERTARYINIMRNCTLARMEILGW